MIFKKRSINMKVNTIVNELNSLAYHGRGIIKSAPKDFQ